MIYDSQDSSNLEENEHKVEDLKRAPRNSSVDALVKERIEQERNVDDRETNGRCKKKRKNKVGQLTVYESSILDLVPGARACFETQDLIETAELQQHSLVTSDPIDSEAGAQFFAVDGGWLIGTILLTGFEGKGYQDTAMVGLTGIGDRDEGILQRPINVIGPELDTGIDDGEEPGCSVEELFGTEGRIGNESPVLQQASFYLSDRHAAVCFDSASDEIFGHIKLAGVGSELDHLIVGPLFTECCRTGGILFGCFLHESAGDDDKFVGRECKVVRMLRVVKMVYRV